MTAVKIVTTVTEVTLIAVVIIVTIVTINNIGDSHSTLKSLRAFNPNLIPHFGLCKFYLENATYMKNIEQKKVYLGIYGSKTYQRNKMPLLYVDSKYPIQQSGISPQFHTENLQSDSGKFNMA